MNESLLMRLNFGWNLPQSPVDYASELEKFSRKGRGMPKTSPEISRLWSSPDSRTTHFKLNSHFWPFSPLSGLLHDQITKAKNFGLTKKCQRQKKTFHFPRKITFFAWSSPFMEQIYGRTLDQFKSTLLKSYNSCVCDLVLKAAFSLINVDLSWHM